MRRIPPGVVKARRADRFGGWLTGAVILHLGAFAGLAAWGPASSVSSRHAAGAAPSVALAVALEWDEPADEEQEQSVKAERAEDGHATSPASGLPPSAVSALRAASTVSASARPSKSTEGGEPSQSDESESAAAAPAPSPAGRSLSLAQLGIGAPGLAYALDEPAPVSEAEHVAQRLNASLSASLALGDSARGLGMEAPALRAVTDLALNGALPLTTSARLLLVVNGSGVTESVSLLEVSADRAEWQRIADELRKKLAAQKLRLPANSAGARLQLVVSSRPLSASGAEAGLDAELFGRAKRTRAATVGRLSVLPRQAEALRAQFPRFDSDSKIMSGFSNNLLSGGADLADLAGGSQRSVSAHLARLDLVSARE